MPVSPVQNQQPSDQAVAVLALRGVGYSLLMGIGTSIFLIAAGAILKYAVNAEVSGVEIDTVGLILMIVGIVGLLISLLYTTLWADRTAPRTREYVDQPPRGDRY
jgi:Domain of unknown function (DUF6458)